MKNTTDIFFTRSMLTDMSFIEYMRDGDFHIDDINNAWNHIVILNSKYFGLDVRSKRI